MTDDRLAAAAERLQDVSLERGFTADTIRAFLARQRGVPAGYVKLDTGRLVAEGEDADDGAD